VARGGRSIINVASIAARFGARFVGQVPHGSAKGGVLAMTKHLCAAGGRWASGPTRSCPA
jgi:meso-butanediol dehydrogenase / (S,S)-butanediol dehydrogenase / diacetyl reductase